VRRGRTTKKGKEAMKTIQMKINGRPATREEVYSFAGIEDPYSERHKQLVIAKLASQGLSLSSEWEEIESCLAQTVCPRFCIDCARHMIEG